MLNGIKQKNSGSSVDCRISTPPDDGELNGGGDTSANGNNSLRTSAQAKRISVYSSAASLQQVGNNNFNGASISIVMHLDAVHQNVVRYRLLLE